MVLAALLSPSKSRLLKNSILSLSLRSIPSTPSAHFSSHCSTTATHSLPPQSPPFPKKVPFTVSAHGRAWQDPYHWMRDTSDPDFLDYLDQENSYARAFMADTQSLQRSLVEEMRSRLAAKISTPPERWGPWLYYQYIPEGEEYPVLCRKLEPEKSGWLNTLASHVKGQLGRRERILLDWNEIAEKHGYVHVGTCRVSPDHKFLAYTLDTTGNEQFVLQIKDLMSGSIVSRSKVDGVVSLAWAQDCSTLFYTIADENQRPYRVFYTKVGSDEVDDVLVFTENDANFCVDITSTKDGKFITVNSNSRTSSEVYVVDSTRPDDVLQRIRKRTSGVQYFLEHHNGFFYILTNYPLPEDVEWSDGNFYLARCPTEHVQTSKWQNIILPGEDMNFQDIDVFNGHLVLFLNQNGVPMLCSVNLPIEVDCKNGLEIKNIDPWFFPLPSNLCTIAPGSNHDFMSPVYRVVLSSPVMPDVIVDYNVPKQTFSIVKQEEVRGVSGSLGSFSPDYNLDITEHLATESDNDNITKNDRLWSCNIFSDAYCCERKEVISQDGVWVPLTILYSLKAWKRGQSPGLLEGYGAYGEVLDKSWCSDRLSLLDRGWVIAFADVRGGGGDSSWHKSGRGLNKRNSINDFVACGDYLVNEGYVHREQLGAIGSSAGGLLVGASINMRPDLFRASILKVPFLDACNTLLDPTLPLTILDYEEFGNPCIQSELECILSYSPYDNIPVDVCLPPMLVTASFHDSRVGVWEAAKWVARVRDSTCGNCSRSIILKTNMSGGHFGEGGCYSQCEETAYYYAFLMKVFGNMDV